MYMYIFPIMMCLHIGADIWYNMVITSIVVSLYVGSGY